MKYFTFFAGRCPPLDGKRHFEFLKGGTEMTKAQARRRCHQGNLIFWFPSSCFFTSCTAALVKRSRSFAPNGVPSGSLGTSNEWEEGHRLESLCYRFCSGAGTEARPTIHIRGWEGVRGRAGVCDPWPSPAFFSSSPYLTPGPPPPIPLSIFYLWRRTWPGVLWFPGNHPGWNNR